MSQTSIRLVSLFEVPDMNADRIKCKRIRFIHDTNEKFQPSGKFQQVTECFSFYLDVYEYLSD